MVRFPPLLGSLLVLAACGGSQQPGGGLYRGDPDGAPSMQVLPDPDVPKDDLSERMQFAWLLTQQSFELQDPEPPAAPSVEELRGWADTELQRWLERKNKLVEAAREELGAAADETHRQRILAGALVGLMYEDVARVLLEVPMPNELRKDREVAEVYEDVVAFQASPYLDHARRAYKACAANAIRPDSMRHWSRFCAERRAQLPNIDDTGQAGNTEVTVSVD